MEGGTTKVYTGPKKGKFYIKNGKNVYLDRKMIADNIPYKKTRKTRK